MPQSPPNSVQPQDAVTVGGRNQGLRCQPAEGGAVRLGHGSPKALVFFAGSSKKNMVLVRETTNALATGTPYIKCGKVDVKASETCALAPWRAKSALVAHDGRKSRGPTALQDGWRFPEHRRGWVLQDTWHEHSLTDGHDAGRLFHGRISQGDTLIVIGGETFQTIDV